MANIEVIDLVGSDNEVDGEPIQFEGSVHEVDDPVVQDWYSTDAIKAAKKRLNAERVKQARERAIIARFRLAKRRVEHERAKLQRKVKLLEKRRLLTWVKPPKRARGRNAPVGHPDMKVIVMAQRVRVKDLIKQTQEEVLKKLPKPQLLRKLGKKQIKEMIVAFLRFTLGKIRALREIHSAFYDYDSVIGGIVFHVQRLIHELEGVVNNVHDFVLAQLDEDRNHVSLRKVRWCPEHWDSQQLLASLWTHLNNEREKLEMLHASYVAVSREPPVIPPLYLPEVDKDDGSQKLSDDEN